MTHDDVASDAGVCLCGDCDAGTERIDRAGCLAELEQLVVIHLTPEYQAWLAEWRQKKGWWELPGATQPPPLGQLAFPWR